MTLSLVERNVEFELAFLDLMVDEGSVARDA